MSTPDKQTVSDAVLSVLRGMPEGRGVKIAEIEAELSVLVSRRTLQRRLDNLITDKQIVRVGEKNGARYQLASAVQAIALSAEATACKRQVQQPIQQRHPVAYHRQFLDDYQPNATFYLPEVTRKELHAIGQTFSQTLAPGTFLKRILHRLLIDLSWNSSRLEGNTYSLLDTERLIHFGAEAEGKQAFEAQMILNHKDAIEFMLEVADKKVFQPNIVMNIHALLSNNLLSNPMARGQLRHIPVGIQKTVYSPPEVPQVIEDCFQKILEKAAKIHDPFEQAFFCMVQLPYLQPFEDVNKRVSRLVANLPLIKHNLLPLSFADVPKDDYISGMLAVYELNDVSLLRDVFIWAYQRSAQQYQVVQETLGEPDLLQLRFREALTAVVQHIISNDIRSAAIPAAVQAWADEHIQEAEKAAFVRMAEREIASLHEGNIAVHRISHAAFIAWQGQR
ncbi:MAG: hypothetical protein DHS20C10_08950 [marine bacterium B5-7]|nr:MAG: hypothetical protein DHS20C10_08950 [marine bacterium B5-7]